MNGHARIQPRAAGISFTPGQPALSGKRYFRDVHMKKTASLFILIVIILILAGGGYFLMKDMTPPSVTLTPQTERIGPAVNLRLAAEDSSSGLKSVTVFTRRNDQVTKVLEKELDGRPKTFALDFNLKDAGLPDGSFILEIKAVDASWAGFGRGNAATRTFNMRYDSVLPRIAIRTLTPYVRRGGSTAIAFTLNKEAAQAWVSVADFTFPAFRQENGEYVCFFAFPYTMTTRDFKPVLHAVDFSGNTASRRVPVMALDRVFKEDTIKLSDAFIESKDAEFMSSVPDAATPLERYLKMNGEVRLANDTKLCEIGRNTAPVRLWSGMFKTLPNAANRAGFAEKRTYIYRGQPVDQQTHLGLDLASVAHAKVPAANHGKVVFAGELGIYGNMIVIDHGQNLQSLYSHLSEIHVSEAAEVRQGDIIGRTGATGMAGGDHLHFTMLISGLPVTPIEWLDPKWIHNNITSRLDGEALQ